MKKNSNGFSLPLAMGLVIVISLLAYTILEYIIPFSKDIKGVENSSIAYYQANSGIEEGMYEINLRNKGYQDNIKTEYSSDNFSGKIGLKYNTTSLGIIQPLEGQGNSEYDLDWNIIGQGNPIQLSIGNGFLDMSQDSLQINFRVPDLDYNGDHDETLNGSYSTPIVFRQLSSNESDLNSSDGNHVKISEIGDNYLITMNNHVGIDLDGEIHSLEEFYSDNCTNIDSDCILKFTIINKLEEATNKRSIPYLEWKLVLDSPYDNTLPLRFTKLESSGKSNGYRKDLDISVSSQTVNQVFDYTIFQ